ncbi:hypothetical protein [Pantoea sp. SoEX]|uniref:hypothetical protein n=1 Tax=Pantoea sp. SoEX TaxID=2576763 RepID=UPI001358CDA5|nr:hypothetical protein [Pantoea sp. SoEX]MXP50810.1 hypothetical protein [Pantoea sp. SoEX]
MQYDITKDAINSKSIKYDLINIDTKADIIEKLLSLGYHEVPVVLKDSNHWYGIFIQMKLLIFIN